MIHDFADDQRVEVGSDVGSGTDELDRFRPVAPSSGVVLVANPGAVVEIRTGGEGKGARFGYKCC